MSAYHIYHTISIVVCFHSHAHCIASRQTAGEAGSGPLHFFGQQVQSGPHSQLSPHSQLQSGAERKGHGLTWNDGSPLQTLLLPTRRTSPSWRAGNSLVLASGACGLSLCGAAGAVGSTLAAVSTVATVGAHGAGHGVGVSGSLQREREADEAVARAPATAVLSRCCGGATHMQTPSAPVKSCIAAPTQHTRPQRKGSGTRLGLRNQGSQHRLVCASPGGLKWTLGERRGLQGQGISVEPAGTLN